MIFGMIVLAMVGASVALAYILSHKNQLMARYSAS
jgi:hypothetical protein